jgi:hypothetical protein
MKTEYFPLRIKSKTRISALITFIQSCAWIPAKAIKQENKIKGIQFGEQVIVYPKMAWHS